QEFGKSSPFSVWALPPALQAIETLRAAAEVAAPAPKRSRLSEPAAEVAAASSKRSRLRVGVAIWPRRNRYVPSRHCRTRRRRPDVDGGQRAAAAGRRGQCDHRKLLDRRLRVQSDDADGLGSRLLRFLRVPYAEPPIGDRRLAKPQPFNFSRSDCRLTGEEAADPEENLLRLSIRTPDLAPADPLPSWRCCSTAPPTSMTASVTKSATLSAQMSSWQPSAVDSASLATCRQGRTTALRISAWRWTAPFGGDPARVTLAGHGAAAAAVGLHAVGSGGFSRVVMMSGSIAAPLGWSALRRSGRRPGPPAGASLSCGIGDEGRLPLDCLRSKPLKDLLDAESLSPADYGDGAGRFAPSFNVSLLPDALWRSGAFNGSLMVGVGTGVGPALAELALRILDAISPPPLGRPKRLGQRARRYLRLTLSDWPHFAYGGRVRHILARALSDFGAVCPVWEAANDLIGSGRGSRLASSSAGAFDFLRFGAKTRRQFDKRRLRLRARRRVHSGRPRCRWPATCPLAASSAAAAAASATRESRQEPFSNTVLRNYTVNILGLGLTFGQTIRTPLAKRGLPSDKPEAACPQPGPLATSEDCLYLNLLDTAHSDREVKNLPVLVFLHGGFFQTGDAFDERWRGSHVLDQVDAVVVTVATDWVALGFLWLQNASVPANLGLRDQALALQWVRAYNVRFFGGSPSKIKPGGARRPALPSVGFHLLAEPPAVPARRPSVGSRTPPSRCRQCQTKCEGNARKFYRSYLNCSQSAPAELLDCLRNLTSSEITSSATSPASSRPFVAFGPALDADFLKSDPCVGGRLAAGSAAAGAAWTPPATRWLRLLLPRWPERDAVTACWRPRVAASPNSPARPLTPASGTSRSASCYRGALGDRHFTCPRLELHGQSGRLLEHCSGFFGFLLAEPAEEIGDRLRMTPSTPWAALRDPSKPLGERAPNLSGFLVRSLVEFANSGNVSWEAYGADSRRVLLTADSGSGAWNVSWPPRYVESALRGLGLRLLGPDAAVRRLA
uniref:COesterase domain-containing protein n=1 Tax=Macrostomum lignano TaxID=282301 RepID=A0A1I8F5T1_9PLAT